MKSFTKLAAYISAALLAVLPAVTACDPNEKTPDTPKTGTISGIVTDESASPLADVTVSVAGLDKTATSAVDGTYTLNGVTIGDNSVTFSKKGYTSVTLVIKAAAFNAEGVAKLSQVSLEFGAGVITGKVLGGDKNPLSGATVKLDGDKTVQTGADGVYRFEELSLREYGLSFSYPEFKTVNKTVPASAFVDGVAQIEDVVLGADEILPGRTLAQLQEAEVWHYNEYKGGKHGDDYPHFDWSVDYMYALNGFVGNYEEQNEGTTLRIRNDDSERVNPADLDHFDSYLYGKKKITADNKILSLRIRTHNADAASPAVFGVQVVDLGAANPVAEKVGENRTYGSGDYGDVHFDLSKYVGKEVIVAIGTYRAETGDYWKQLVLRRIAFGPSQTTDWNWLPGSFVDGMDAWKMTKEIVRSTQPITERTSFNACHPFSAVPEQGPNDWYAPIWKDFRTDGHIAGWWCFMPVRKDPEPQAGEGFIIKTKSEIHDVDLSNPHAYFFAKFSISAGHNNLLLRVRNFAEKNTYFQVGAIPVNTLAFEGVAPASQNAQHFEQLEKGVVKFYHDNGGKDSPNDYAQFTFDLSKFNGQDVVLTIAVFKGEDSGEEDKLCIHSVEIK